MIYKLAWFCMLFSLVIGNLWPALGVGVFAGGLALLTLWWLNAAVSILIGE